MITLRDLPPPPPNRTGWPWTEPTVQSSESSVESLPKITIVTPSFNQGQYLEETIRSVLLQNYPNLEYFVIDGGSTDNSVEIIRKYEKWIQFWISEKDRGQSHAINKGLERATGTLINWLNSDDTLLPGALHELARAQREKHEHIYVGNFQVLLGEAKKYHKVARNFDIEGLSKYWLGGFSWNQAAIFFTSKMLRECGPLREELHFAMDYELFLRFTSRYPTAYIPRELAVFRLHRDSKTVAKAESFLNEVADAAEKHWPARLPKPDFQQRRREFHSVYWSGMAVQSIMRKELFSAASNLKRACKHSLWMTCKRLLGPRRILRLWRETRDDAFLA